MLIFSVYYVNIFLFTIPTNLCDDVYFKCSDVVESGTVSVVRHVGNVPGQILELCGRVIHHRTALVSPVNIILVCPEDKYIDEVTL